MSTYLLLRDNKQSGSYTLDEITVKGFKKYDLVWIENKSAAWRYPGEIAELKSFAPIIEEQPFDRFFKKPSEEKQATNISQTSPIKAEIVESAALPQIILEVGDKKVYASLPAKKESAVPVREAISYKEATKEKINSEAPKPAMNDYVFAEKATEAQPWYNSDQFKEGISSPKKENPYRRYMQPAMLAACVITLLGTGIFIGLSINKGNPTPASKTDAMEKQIASANKPEAQNLLIPVSSLAPPAEEKAAKADNGVKDNDLALQTITTEQEKKPVAFNEKKKNNSPKANTALSSQKEGVKQERKIDSSYYASVPHREATHRTGAVNDKDLIKNDIANLVSISSNKYHVGTFGGISEVQLTVSNKTIYPLDLVMVEVQYIQANKKIFKTENVYFHNVRPGEAMMVEAPESSRGIKVQYKVSLINSKELSISYSGT